MYPEYSTVSRRQNDSCAGCRVNGRWDIVRPEEVALPGDLLAQMRGDDELCYCSHCGAVWFQHPMVETRQYRRHFVGRFDAMGGVGFFRLAQPGRRTMAAIHQRDKEPLGTS
jgi:hypothetical protein